MRGHQLGRLLIDRVFGSFIFQEMKSSGSTSNGEHLAVGMDVADSLSVEDGFRKAVKHFGGDPPAIIVNSAGTTIYIHNQSIPLTEGGTTEPNKTGFLFALRLSYKIYQ